MLIFILVFAPMHPENPLTVSRVEAWVWTASQFLPASNWSKGGEAATQKKSGGKWVGWFPHLRAEVIVKEVVSLRNNLQHDGLQPKRGLFQQFTERLG